MTRPGGSGIVRSGDEIFFTALGSSVRIRTEGHQCVDPVVGEEADPTESATPLMRLLPDYSETTLDLGWEAKMN